MLLSTRSSDDDQVIRSLASLELLDLGFPLLLLLFLGFQLYTIVHTHTTPKENQKKDMDQPAHLLLVEAHATRPRLAFFLSASLIAARRLASSLRLAAFLSSSGSPFSSFCSRAYERASSSETS